jgi:glycosyltransferase involved in cell wall biosynthesis
MSIRVSVILPTSARAASVGDTLTTVVSQTLASSDFEILVVENGQESATRELTQQVSRSNLAASLRYLHDPTPGLLSGRHRGALEARGDILVFADDDIDASPGWLSAVVETFSDPAVHLVGGRSLPRFAAPPPQWAERFWYTPPYGGRACIHLSLLDLGETPLAIDANYVWGLNFAIRRATLFELGGFHPDNIPDHLQHFQGDGETGLTMKANDARLRAIYQPRAVIHHRIPAGRLTVEYFRRRAFYQGVCDSFTAIRRDPACLAVSTEAEEREAQHHELPSDGETTADRNRDALARPTAAFRPDSTPSSEPTFEEVELQVHASYQAGYGFHQDAVRRYPKLLEWVTRKDYWDYRLPDLGPSVDVRPPNP